MKLKEFFIKYGITKTKECRILKHKTIPNPKYDPSVNIYSPGAYGGAGGYFWRDKPHRKTISVENGSEIIQIPDLYMRSSEENYFKRYAETELESWVILPGLMAWGRLVMKVQKKNEPPKHLYITLKGTNHPSIQMSSYPSYGLNAGNDIYTAATTMIPDISVSDSFKVEAMLNKMEEM